MKPNHLRDLLRLVQAYIKSTTSKTPPKKAQLFAAVQSLLPRDVTLSPKWDKTQLALVLKKWCITALKLSPFAAQPSLFARVRASDTDAKKLSHSCFINDEGNRVLTFAMQSPSPNPPNPLTVGDLATDKSAAPSITEDFGDANYDEEFLREIDDLALDASIGEDVIPTIFYTPRVTGGSLVPASGAGISSSRGDESPGDDVTIAVPNPPNAATSVRSEIPASPGTGNSLLSSQSERTTDIENANSKSKDQVTGTLPE